ncbi:hypothetical protein ACS0TY_019347 [Phlomoides rotata]
MEFIKERCIQMRNDLLNWNPTTTSNADGSLRTSQRTEVDDNPMLDPRVANPRGRPRQTRYMSTAETRGRGRGRGRGGRGRGTRTASRGRGVASSSPTSQENNDESFSFDLNEDPIGSQGSFIF